MADNFNTKEAGGFGLTPEEQRRNNMLPYAQIFVDYLDQESIKYTVRDERSVKIVYSGNEMDSIPVFVFFDKDGDPYVTLKCWEIANFKNNPERGMQVCNELNAKYRWVKFYIDSDNDVMAELDAVIDQDTCGAECLHLVRRMVSIVDGAFPTVQKARWA